MSNDQWSVIVNNQQYGPTDTETLKSWIVNRSVNANTLVWRPGMEEWKSAGEVSDLVGFFELPPPELSGVGDETISVEQLQNESSLPASEQDREILIPEVEEGEEEPLAMDLDEEIVEDADESDLEEELPDLSSDSEKEIVIPEAEEMAEPKTPAVEIPGEAPEPAAEETAEEAEAQVFEEEPLIPEEETEKPIPTMALDEDATVSEKEKAGDFKYEILCQPSYAILKLQLSDGDYVTGQAGSLVSMSKGIKIKSASKAGFFSFLSSRPSLVTNTYHKTGGAGEVSFAPNFPGDIFHYRLEEGDTLTFQSNAYLASTSGVKLETKWKGSRSFFTGDKQFALRATGDGSIFLSAHGAIHRINLKQDDTYIIDTGHLVAFSGALKWKTRGAGMLKSAKLKGEGLACECTGPGTIYLQTRSESSFVSHLASRLRG